MLLVAKALAQRKGLVLRVTREEKTGRLIHRWMRIEEGGNTVSTRVQVRANAITDQLSKKHGEEKARELVTELLNGKRTPEDPIFSKQKLLKLDAHSLLVMASEQGSKLTPVTTPTQEVPDKKAKPAKMTPAVAQTFSERYALETAKERKEIERLQEELDSLTPIIMDWQSGDLEKQHRAVERSRAINTKLINLRKQTRSDIQWMRADFYRRAWAHEAKRLSLPAKEDFAKVPTPPTFNNGEEASKWLQERYPHIAITLQGMDKKAANAVSQQFVRLSQQLPDVFRRLESLTIAHGGNNVPFGSARCGVNGDSWRTDNSKIVGRYDWMVCLYGNHFDSDRKLINAIRRGVAARFHPPTEDPGHVLSHEISHILHTIIEETGSAPVKVALTKWIEKTPATPISYYAQENDREKFAEAFVWMLHCPQEEWPPGIAELKAIIQRHYAGKPGGIR